MNQKITMNAREINAAARNIIDRLDDERIKQHSTIINYRDEVASLKSRLQRLKEVGEPFADRQVIEFYDKVKSTSTPDDWVWHTGLASGAGKVTVGQIRALAEELDKTDKPKEKEGEK